MHQCFNHGVCSICGLCSEHCLGHVADIRRDAGIPQETGRCALRFQLTGRKGEKTLTPHGRVDMPLPESAYGAT